MIRLPRPTTYAPGDMVTHCGRIATRGRRYWTWASTTRLEHLLTVLFERMTDTDMDDYLDDEEPDAYVCWLAERSA